MDLKDKFGDDSEDLKARLKQLEKELDEIRSDWNQVDALLIKLDEKKHILTVNEKVLDITGFTEDEIVGKNWEDLFTSSALCPDCIAAKEQEPFSPPAGERRNGSKRFFRGDILGKRDRRITVDWTEHIISQADGSKGNALMTGQIIHGAVESPQSQGRDCLKYRHLMEHSIDLIYRYDRFPSPGFSYVSSSSERMVGYRPEDFYTDPDLFFNMVHPDDRSDIKDLFDSRTATSKILQFRLLTRDGKEVWTEDYLNTIQNNRGEVIAIQGIVRDISETIRLRREIKLEKEQYQEFIDGSQDLVTQVDHEGRFTFVNHMVQTIYGVDPKDCIGKPAFDYIHPEDQESTLTAFQAWVKNRSVHEVFENRQVSRDGKIYHIHWDIHFHYDKSGNLSYVNSIGRDISELKRLELELKKFQQAVENSTLSIVISDPEGRLQYANPQLLKLTGYAMEELIGENPRIFRTDYHGEPYYKSLWQTIKGGQSWKGEFKNRKKDGSFYWEQAHISPIKNAEGEITHFIGIKEDITEIRSIRDELEQNLEQLRELNGMKNRFLSIIAHDLRGPLGSLSQGLALLNRKREHWSPGKIADYSMKLEKSASTTVQLMKNLFAWAESQQNQIANLPEYMIVQPLLEEIARDLEFMTSRKKIRLAIEPSDLQVYADRNMVATILRNLISNAIKFSYPDQYIEVEIRNEGEITAISVRDEGVGISQENLENLFRIDKRISARGTENEIGTGLGLLLCQEFASKSGGSISVDSEAGVGSTFTLRLPSLMPAENS